MSTSTISPLRQRMIKDMNARQLSVGTQKAHLRSCKRFTAFLGRGSPNMATSEDIRRFQQHLVETEVSICNCNGIMSGIKFLFRITLRRLVRAIEPTELCNQPPPRSPLSQNPHKAR